MKLTDHKGYMRFWIASTTSDFGTYITTLALQVLVVTNMHGSSVDVGWINAALWIAILGLAVVGAWFALSPMRDARIDEQAAPR
ncbi:hypothetical protein [Paenibacillus rhizovicinus]|uniref:hypothetical protein n=1 Tax=Paenibacillus rhizovicinus TaxID=2704463 RepID=UPI001CDC4E31|nr:hypothetical protein [Paenibacillus rhizovicinus]